MFIVADYAALKRMLVFWAETHKMHVRIANGDDPDQTASSEAV